MGNYYVSGGGNLLAVFSINAAHTQASLSDAAPVIQFALNEQTQLTKQETGEWQITATQLEDDAALYNWLAGAVPEAEATVAEITLEDGTKVGGATASSVDYLIIVKGGKTNESPNMRKVFSGIARFSKTSGSYSQKDGEFTKPTLTATTQKCLTLITLTTALSTLSISTNPTLALAANSKGKVTFQSV